MVDPGKTLLMRCSRATATPEQRLYRTNGYAEQRLCGATTSPDLQLHRSNSYTGATASPDLQLHRSNSYTGATAIPDLQLHRSNSYTGATAMRTKWSLYSLPAQALLRYSSNVIGHVPPFLSSVLISPVYVITGLYRIQIAPHSSLCRSIGVTGSE